MSEGKRRRYRKDEKRTVILAKRQDDQQHSAEVQPKILLKTREKDESDIEVPQKTIIITRSDVATTQSPALLSISPNSNVLKEQQVANVDANQAAVTALLLEPVPLMTRPATVISSTGFVNNSAKKLLIKTNSDFLVVGIIGTQGVGKSTIMNLLANDAANYDYYQKVFVQESSIFPTKIKHNKCSARSRTESTHMFVTRDRLILLDSPPVLSNSYRKDMTSNELDDLRNIICLLSVCHLLIVVQDDYFNINFLRLLQFAELMKPTHNNAPFASDYMPNVLFVKNRAKRVDFETGQQQRINQMLKVFFKDTQLRVHVGQTIEQQRQRKMRALESERIINSILLPEVKVSSSNSCSSSFHKPLEDIIADLRALVFSTPRCQMHASAAAGAAFEFNETTWFDMLTQVAQDTQHFFYKTYEDVHHKQLDVGNTLAASNIGMGGSTNNGNNNRDNYDNWRD